MPSSSMPWLDEHVARRRGVGTHARDRGGDPIGGWAAQLELPTGLERDHALAGKRVGQELTQDTSGAVRGGRKPFELDADVRRRGPG